MLFKSQQYFAYKFPEPQYLGSKYIHLNWFMKYIPNNIKISLDAFSGTQSMAFLFKQLGHQVITNDFLNFNHQIGLSLIENRNQVITPEDLEILFYPSPQKKQFTLIEETFTNLFFTKEEAIFLDNYRANVQYLSNKFKRSLALTLMNRSLQRKITMGHFAHTQALIYANNFQRIKRNPNLIRPIKDILLELIEVYNLAIFDNLKENKSFCQNILEILPILLEQYQIDFAYFDPPYCDSHADYQSFYHLLETYSEYWVNKKFVNKIKRYEPQKYSGFDKKQQILESFHTLFKYAQHIPNWLISYNDRSYPSIEELKNVIQQYKDVQIVTKKYHSGRGGRGSVAGSQEVLFICSHKKIFYYNSDIHHVII